MHSTPPKPIDQADDDDYAAYNDFAQFTEEDFAQIDMEISTTLRKGLPKVNVELEVNEEAGPESLQPIASTSNLNRASSPNPSPGPFQRFRRNGVFSVTDLVSPAWCEVQFDYGLRQKRSRKLEHRPGSFTAESGKEIVVDQKVAAVNDEVTKKGKSIHKKLEQEVRPEEVVVEVTTNEERWALRFLNMISSFDSLILLGYSREIPVFGLVHGYVTIGVIDEVRRLPVNRVQTSKKSPVPPRGTSRSGKESHNTSSTLQTPITAFLSPRKDSSAERETTYSLHLLDTKTRRKNSLPDDEDAVSSRLQLMLYSRLLTDLLGPFDFNTFWEKLDLDPNTPFSETFLYQMGLLVNSSSPSVLCLADIHGLWIRTVSRLDVAGVDPTLELVYRLQMSTSKQGAKRKRANENVDGISIDDIKKIEEDEIARAIQASLEDLPTQDTADSSNSGLNSDRIDQILSPNALRAASPNNDGNVLGDDPELAWAIQLSLLTHSNASHFPSQDAVQNLASDIEGTSEDAPIIGSKQFTFDGMFLDSYLDDVLQWWRGTRKPRGVSLQQSWRCSFCEYRQGCEWREQKAKEIEEKLKNRDG
ncbi:hypothetical protein K435DRAFT_853830 [Dendrothele bispora CBS 962.96]|uniref:Exonuclease V n=1 Tax=Dendrothele bispora (strain CBS 962.96) TaxID=1314807 RepID=A0A4S8MG23_DENBC|nr:hypothetical protein K435DRAFT_853830 [Dendrothele bispora CBS 962.96]